MKRILLVVGLALLTLTTYLFLKDNAHDEQALGPGKGSIPWRETLAALRA